MEKVILVNEQGKEIGTCEIMEAHLNGLLHRAFSVFIVNSKGKWLVQQRAKNKYHSGELWTNACSGHPRPGEEIDSTAHRLLQEEMGFDCELREVHTFIYDTKFDNGLMECEYDHVFLGTYDGEVQLNREEVSDYQWLTDGQLGIGLRDNPRDYTYWFRLVYPKISALQMGESEEKI